MNKAKRNKVLIIIVLLFSLSFNAYSSSTRHHLINMGKNLTKCIFSPLYGIFIQGPKNIKEAYQYEVWEREKPEKRGQLRYKLFSLWRAPGEETKGIIDGLVDSTKAGGQVLKEFISIFFSD